MDVFDLALTLYREGKAILDESRDFAASDDLLRWAREDLEDALLDTKQAWQDRSEELVVSGIVEAVVLIREVERRMRFLRGR